MSVNSTSSSTPTSNDLGDLCPPCKLLLNGNGARTKLELFFDQLAQLAELGYELTKEGNEQAIKTICGFDEAMDEVLKLVVSQVQQKA